MATRVNKKTIANEAIPPQPKIVEEVEVVRLERPDQSGIEMIDDDPDFPDDTDLMFEDPSDPIDIFSTGNADVRSPAPAFQEQAAAASTDLVSADLTPEEQSLLSKLLAKVARKDVVVATPIVVQDAAPRFRVVKTNADVGPVYYGADEIELKKGVKYRVPEHVYQYLHERDLIWSVA